MNGLWEDAAKSVLPNVAQTAASAPQTQKDLNTLAKAAETAQSPQFQSTLKKVETGVAAYAGVTVFLQLVSTAAIVAMAYFAYTEWKKKQRNG